MKKFGKLRSAALVVMVLTLGIIMTGCGVSRSGNWSTLQLRGESVSQDNVSTTVTHNFHFAHRGNTWGQNRETNMIALRRDVRTTLNDETTTFTLTQLVLNFDHIVQMNLLPHRADDFTGTIRFRNGTGENDTWNSLGASGTGSIVVQTNNASQRTHSRMSITQGQALRTVNADQPLTIDFYYRLSTDPLATAEGFTPRHFSFTFELPRGNF